MKEFDAVVIGSGPIGISTARRLAERGRSVLVLEAGPTVSRPPGSHLRNFPQLAGDSSGYLTAISPYLRYVDGDLPGANESALVGGQGVLWTNNCPRAVEFERWGKMTAGEWAGWYLDAEQMLQVQRTTGQSDVGRWVSERLRGLVSESDRTIENLPLAGRIEGERVRYVGPSDVLAAAEADVRARITLRDRAVVTLLTMGSGRVRSVEAQVNGSKEEFTAKIVVVAGGTVATPRLLWQSGIRPAALGRGVSFHALFMGQLVLEEEEVRSRSEAERGPRLLIPPVPDWPWQVMLVHDVCPFTPTEAIADEQRLMEIQAFLPVEFSDENALSMAEDGSCDFRFQFSTKDREWMAAMQADVESMAAALGRWRHGCEPVWIPHGNSHIVGTCRMDLPDWPGVADEFGRVHGVEGLYLATVGLIPAPMAANPTLTGVAIALRTCEEICA